jgi:hypothetical protein
MNFLTVFLLVHAVLFGLAWKFARRRLSDREMLAWQWREDHPYACWLRVVVASGTMLIAMIFILFTAIEVYVQKQSFRSVMDRQLAAYEPALMTLVMSLVIGTIVFSFWYWNGLALYRGRLLEAARASSRQADG